MKITTWNVAGLRAMIKKNGFDWIQEFDPDVICLQEIKATAGTDRRTGSSAL